jgi:hypothetical protein
VAYDGGMHCFRNPNIKESPTFYPFDIQTYLKCKDDEGQELNLEDLDTDNARSTDGMITSAQLIKAYKSGMTPTTVCKTFCLLWKMIHSLQNQSSR